VEEASKRAHRDKTSLKDALAAEPKVTAVVPANELSKLFDPMSYQGVAQAFIDRLVATAKAGR
jgi:3-carboxy-cis,cis-muconate cycloisomerase